MEITDLRKHQEWQSPTLTSLAGLLSSNAFTQLREHQLQMNCTVAPVLDNIHKHQELIQKIMTPSFAQATNICAMTMATKPAMEAMAAWQQPITEMSATIAAQQKVFAQIARATKLTAMQEMLQHIHNCTPAVQVTIPKIDAALSAIKYIEENQPELCKQVDETLDVSTDIENNYDNIDAYLLFCEQTMAGLSGLITITADPEIKNGLICLLVLISHLFIYLKYCKSQKEKERS